MLIEISSFSFRQDRVWVEVDKLDWIISIVSFFGSYE